MPHSDGTNNGSSSIDDKQAHLPIFEPVRTLKVITVGAGASGLLIAYKLQRHFDDFELDVYEKNEDMSGTWYENRYPG